MGAKKNNFVKKTSRNTKTVFVTKSTIAIENQHFTEKVEKVKKLLLNAKLMD